MSVHAWSLALVAAASVHDHDSSTLTVRGTLFATFNPTPDPVVPDPPDVVEDPAWLIATSGFCSNLNVVIKERVVEASETEGNTAAHFVADIEFNYYPQTALRFTDFPHHLAKTIKGDAAEADALVSSAWDHKNIALLEPTSACGRNGEGDQAWGISTFMVEEHRHCTGGETAWEGHPCVHYSGYVSAATSNFINVNEGRFVCQLFVDAGEHPKSHSFLLLQLATCPFPNFQCPQHGKRGNPVTFVFLVVRYAQGYDIYLWLPTTACWFSIGQKPKVYPNKKSLKTDC